MTPILYSFRRCPYAIRARLALDASGQTFELREIALRDKPAEMLRISPKGTVPVLVVAENKIIDESLDIMLWALTRSDPHDWLTPGADTHEGMLALIARFDSHFKPCLDGYKYPSRGIGIDSVAQRDAACMDLQRLQDRLVTSAYLSGEEVSLADFAIAPFVRQFANVDADWFAKRWSDVQRWLMSIVESARFARVMEPIAVWVPGTRGVPFPAPRP